MRRIKRLPIEELNRCLFPSPPAAEDHVPSPLGGEGQGEGSRLDWQRVFGNDREVEIEVGFGKGLFLLTEAQKRPAVNFHRCGNSVEI